LLRSFQRRSGLPMTGFPDAVTMRALREACAGSAMPSQPDMEPAPGAEPSPAEEPAADAAADEPPPAAEEIGLQGETATERVLRTLPADLRVTWESAGSLHTAAN